jgi:thioredoxin 1
MTKSLNGKNFTEEIIQAGGLSVVQFRTKWNGGCQIIAPIYEELSRLYAAKANFFSIDTEREKQIADEYRIVELPTILFFKNGRLIDHVVGLAPKHTLITKIEDAIAGIIN